jgi:bifunctional non-homologous end joining protein LigD
VVGDGEPTEATRIRAVGYNASMSRLLPMLASAGTPSEVAGPEWTHEFKWDGVRALVATDGASVTMRSRLGNDVTAAYPELHGVAEQLGRPALLDGEIVAFDDEGVPSFSVLQSRMHLRDPGRIRMIAATTPVKLLVFDVLMLDGDWLLEAPYTRRRDQLEGLALDDTFLATPPRTKDLAACLQAAADRGLEGVVSKRDTSIYRPGTRSKDWRKLRLVTEQEFVVVGYRRGKGGRAGGLGAVLVGYVGDDGWHLAGAVGSGLTAREIEELTAILEPVSEPPVVDGAGERDVVWVAPTTVVQVRFREWTPDGRLRQPTYRGRRSDVDPATVRRDQ